MDPVDTIEIVLPVLGHPGPIRAALARRRGVSEWNVIDAEILAAFTTRHAGPAFVYDWQDAYSAAPARPGKFPSPITAFPTTVSFLAYPAGTWVKAERAVINLDTVYDNAMLTNNQFTALFTEDGFAVMKMCVDSRLYTANFTPGIRPAAAPDPPGARPPPRRPGLAPTTEEVSTHGSDRTGSADRGTRAA